MKKLFFIAFALMLSFTTAFAECRNYPKDQPFAELEPDSGSGDEGGKGGGSYYQYRFVSYCGLCYVLTIDHKLSESENAYWQGYYDGLCPKNLFYL